MFSFLKFLNPKSDTDKNNLSNNLSNKTLNLNSSEARFLNIFNTKSAIARKPNGDESSLRNNSKETVTSPGFSFRIAQKVREARSTTPNTDTSNLSTSYTLENSLNGINNTIPRNIYDKKRKLMETLDNFGVRKKTRQECGVDAFVNRRRKTINESSNVSDRVTVMNGHNHRVTQPIMNSKNVNVENKKIKRSGDFGSNINHLQKKPKTRNNEILSSYSSSKFLITSGQKRRHSNDNEGDSPDRKHCKSCTCCGSTVLLESNKKDKTTETDPSDNFVTVAASRIFNRSGKTQIIKKMCMKTILDEVFEDTDTVPYISIDKIEEKKKKITSVEQYSKKSDMKYDNQSVNSLTSVSSTVVSKCNELQLPVTSISSIVSPTLDGTVDKISAVPITSTTLLSTSLVQSKNSPTFCISPSESRLKINEENKNNTSLPFSFGSSISSATLLSEANKQINEVDGKEPNQTPEFTNSKINSLNTIVQNTNDKSQVEQNNCKSDKDKQSLHFTEPTSKLNESINSTTINGSSNSPVVQFGVPKNDDKQSTLVMQFGASKVDEKQSTPVMQFGSPKLDGKQLTPVMQFGAPKIDEKQSTPVMQFGSPKLDEKQLTPVMQFGAPKIDEKHSTPVMQFGAPKVDEKQSTPVMQFGAPKVDEKQSTPVMQFGAPKLDEKQSTLVMQFGAPKVDEKQSTPVMQFGAPKVDEKQSTPVMKFGSPKVDEKSSIPILQFGATKETEKTISTSLFSFGSNNQKSGETTKTADSGKFQFGSAKHDNPTIAVSSVKSTNAAVFGGNNLQNKNLFNFGKSDNIPSSIGNPPNYDASNENTNSKLQFNTLSTPVFGTSTSNVEQSKPQFITSINQSNDNQTSKLVFGNQITESKPTTSPSNIFNSNTGNSMFQFNNSTLKPNDKTAETSGNSFPFTSTKTAPTFGISATQDFGNKSAFQFNAPKKTEDPKTQFSTTVFGSQNTTTSAPFKFGSNDKPASFGSTFSSSNQPIQFTNNEKSKEPFKFGSTVPSNNAFQFSTNKAADNSVKFGQTSNTFSVPEFNGFGNSTPQQITTFGNVSSTQPTPFGNITSNAAPTFGNTTSSPSNTFGTNQGFQFGNTNYNPSNSSTFAFTGNSQPTKSGGAFNFNAASTTTSPFQFGQTPSTTTPQFGGTQGAFGFGSPSMTATVMPGSSQSLFSMGTAPTDNRRKAKAVRRRQ